MQLQVVMQDNATMVSLPDDWGTLLFTQTPGETPPNGLRVNVLGGRVAGFGAGKADEAVLIVGPPTVTAASLQRGLQGASVPGEQAAYIEAVKRVLTRFGVALTPAKPAKARHRFERALATTPFRVARNGSVATVYWTKRNELTVAAGAKLAETAPVNRDGSKRVGTKYGEQLRAEHAEAIAGHTTVLPIHLRSVNEVGLFLYFGDTNGWLALVNDDGVTLDALTRID